MQLRYHLVSIAPILLALACGKDSVVDKRLLRGASLDATPLKLVHFEFSLPDRTTLVAENPEIISKLTGFHYRIQGEGSSCPAGEIHEDSGLYDDGRMIAFDVVASCSYLISIRLGEYVPPAPAATLTAKINYKDHIKNIVDTNCVSCHAPYASYSGLKEAARGIVMAVENESMPPPAPLQGSDIALMLAWADGGFAETDPNEVAPSAASLAVSKVYYRNDNNDYLKDYELLGRTTFELRRSLWLQPDGQSSGFVTSQLYTFYAETQ